MACGQVVAGAARNRPADDDAVRLRPRPPAVPAGGQGDPPQHLTAAQSLYDSLAELLVGLRARCVLDIGCGEGALRAALQPRLVGLDASATMLRTHPPPVVQAAAALPFVADVFDSSTPRWPATCWTISPSRPSRSTRLIVSWSPGDPDRRHQQPPRLAGAGPRLATAVLQLRRRGRARAGGVGLRAGAGRAVGCAA